MKTYDLIVDRWAPSSGTISSDLAPNQPLRMVVLQFAGALVSAPNQPSATIRIAMTSTQAEAVAKVLAGLARDTPSIPEQISDYESTTIEGDS